MNRWRWVFMSILVFSVLSGCAARQELYSESDFIFGTRVVISLYPRADRNIKDDLSSLFLHLEKFDAIFNPRKQGSLVQKLNMKRRLGFSLLPEFGMLQELLNKSYKIASLAKGAFDPTIYALSKLWGFSEPLPLVKPPQPDEIMRARTKVNYNNLKISQNKFISLSGKVKIDLGGIAKGYAADLVATKLKTWGYDSGIVYVGGDIVLLGYKKHMDSKLKWEVGIQHPRLKNKYFCRLYLASQAVVTSGDYEKFYIYQGQRYHHLINPKTGYPTTGLISCTVIGEKAADADAYATTIMVLGVKKGIEFINKIDNYEAMVIKKESSQMKALFSKNFKKISSYKKE